jgi:hypothetical protein
MPKISPAPSLSPKISAMPNFTFSESNLQCFGFNTTDMKVCSSNGNCTSRDSCVCNIGYSGTKCEMTSCFGEDQTSPKVCSSHGNCTNINLCSCFNGYYGSQCEMATCFGKNSSDPTVCSGNGVCSRQDRCICNVGYIGTVCEIISPYFGEIECVIFGDEYLRYYKREKEVVIETTICSQDGWGGIAFHKSSGIESSNFISVSWYSQTDRNQLKFSEIQSHQKKSLSTTNLGYLLPTEKYFPEKDFVGKQRYTMVIDQLNLENYDHVSIVCSNSHPNSNMTFPRHERVITRYFNVLNSKSICDAWVLSGFSNRLSDISLEFWFLEQIFYILMFGVVFYFRNTQPLKSRTFIPALASMSSIQYFYFNLEWRSRYGCLLQIMFYENFLTCIFAILPLNYIRHILLINLNIHKEQISETGSKSLYLNFYTFVKILTNPIVLSISLFFFWLITSFVDFFILLVFSPHLQCITGKSFGVYATDLFVNTVIGLLFFAILLIDIIVNVVHYFNAVKRKSYKKNVRWTVLKGSLIEFFIESDPFLFRMEKIFSTFIFLFYFCFEMINFNILIIGKDNGFYFYFGKYASTIGRSFITYFIAFYQGFLPLIMTVLSNLFIYFRLKCGKKPTTIEANYMEDEDLFDILFEFAKEWSSENLLALRDIKKYKNKRKSENRRQHAFDMYYRYFNGSYSPLEVNILENQSIELFRVINDPKAEMEDDLFASVEQTLSGNVSDTWSRFRFTIVLAYYERNKEYLQNELKEL